MDFSDLSSEYIGILYEGLLDFELRRAGREPAHGLPERRQSTGAAPRPPRGHDDSGHEGSVREAQEGGPERSPLPPKRRLKKRTTRNLKTRRNPRTEEEPETLETEDDPAQDTEADDEKRYFDEMVRDLGQESRTCRQARPVPQERRGPASSRAVQP